MSDSGLTSGPAQWQDTGMTDLEDAVQSTRSSRVPDYRAIVSGSRWIRFFAFFVRLAGWCKIAIGVPMMVLTQVGAVTVSDYGYRYIHGALQPEWLYLPLGVALTFGGALLIALGHIMRMVGVLAIAARDVAQNSFRRNL